MESRIRFAVVVVTYNRKELLKECVDAILMESVPIDYIIIVDNASTDGTDVFLKRYKDDARFLISTEEENRGGAYGFYQGIKLSLEYDWDWLIVIDDDAILDTDFTEVIEEAIYKYPDNKAFSGKVITGGAIATEHRARNLLKYFYKPFPVKGREYEEESFEYELSSFCGLVIGREMVQRIGLPLKELFIRNDDYEYSLRIAKITKIRNINDATVYHKTTIPTKDKDFSWKLFYNMRNAIYIAGKHFGPIAKTEICIRYLLGMLLNIIRYGIFRGRPVRGIWQVYSDAVYAGMANRIGSDSRYQAGMKAENTELVTGNSLQKKRMGK